jgi:hypothetical protein
LIQDDLAVAFSLSESKEAVVFFQMVIVAQQIIERSKPFPRKRIVVNIHVNGLHGVLSAAEIYLNLF